MTDLEIVRACAVAMGWETRIDTTEQGRVLIVKGDGYSGSSDDGFMEGYYPLTDDAQAMALAKRFSIDVQAPQPPVWSYWVATCWPEKDGKQDRSGRNCYGRGDTLNIAVCLCVASLHQPTRADDGAQTGETQ